jgi:tetratricopeptide (TPR) repeat protein
MNRIFAISIVVTFIFSGARSYAQYNRKQIDGLLDSANHSDLEQGIKLAMTAYNASKAMDYQEGMVRALLLRAVKCSNVRHYEDAFRYAVEAESAAINNPRYLAVLAVIKGISYTNLGFYQDGKETLISAIPIAQNIPDSDQRHERLGNIYVALSENNELSKGDIKTTFIYTKKSYMEYGKIKNTSRFAYVIALPLANLGNIFLKLKQYDSAKFYLNKAVLLANRDNEDISAALADNDLGRLYFQQKKYLTAEIYFKIALNANAELKNANELKDACVGLSKVYTALNDNVKAQQYLERSVELSDSLANVEKTAIKTPLNYIVKYKEQQLAESKGRDLWIMLLICALLMATISIVFLNRYRFKKEIKLSTEKMNELVKKIELNENNSSPSKIEKLKEVVQLAVNNNPAFLMKFNEFDPEFSKRLLKIAPSMIAPEIEFCALLRLNFETKEIARYNRLSVRAVEGKKYRIRKKLNIPHEHDTNAWIAHV